MVKVRNWCAFANTRRMSGAAQTNPTFHPVSEKILPAEPILTVRSRMPRHRYQRDMAEPVENDVLPHFIAKRDRVVLYDKSGREVLDPGGHRRYPPD